MLPPQNTRSLTLGGIGAALLAGVPKGAGAQAYAAVGLDLDVDARDADNIGGFRATGVLLTPANALYRKKRRKELCRPALVGLALPATVYLCHFHNPFC